MLKLNTWAWLLAMTTHKVSGLEGRVMLITEKGKVEDRRKDPGLP